MRMLSVRNERGIALVVAIVALVVIGAIITGTFFMSTIEQRTAMNASNTSRAFEAAEAGMHATIGSWVPVSYAPGTDVTFGKTAVPNAVGDTFQVTVSPLNAELLLVRSVGTSIGGATQTLASAVRLNTADVNVTAAITTTSPINFNGAAFVVNGNNSDPAGWNACPPGTDHYAIRTSSNQWFVPPMQQNQQDNVTGLGNWPSVQTNQSDINSNTFTNFGDVTYDQMAAYASIQFGNSQTGPYQPTPTLNAASGRCNYGNIYNWGEPWRTPGYIAECANYFPTIHAMGNLHLNGGSRGQGILLVDGDLTVTGGFQFYGLVIAKGSVDLGGTGSDGGKIFGGLFSQNIEINDQSLIQGNASVQYSNCAILRALTGGALPVPLSGHAWTQVYN
ncbi:MAG: PilX N-terminal domain-containing pilus assembly protein [Gemmatimonadales bacterium]